MASTITTPTAVIANPGTFSDINTAIGGTAAATVKAVQADGSTNTADVSTVDVLVTNW